MRPLDALRDRLARASAARTSVLADARDVFPDIPRDADSGRLIRHAHRLVLGAARDEFAREGVTLVSIPEGWGRAELRRADLASDSAFQGFVEEVIRALDIAPSTLERDDALVLRDGPYSADSYGFSLEASADLASYLLSRAWVLRALEAADAAADGTAPREITADTQPSPGDEEEFFSAEAARLRDAVRDRLVRLVRVPLELRAAVERHEQLEGADPVPLGTDAQSDVTGAGRRAREDLARTASAAYGFARSEAGRAALGVLRDRAGKAYDRTRRDDQEPREN